jgi:hypothetical protein
MGLETGHPCAAHHCVMRRARDELEPIAGGEVDWSVSKPETDRAGGDDDDLVVIVVMRGIPIARPVGPGAGIKTLLDQSRSKRAGIRHGRRIVPVAAGKWRRRVA